MEGKSKKANQKIMEVEKLDKKVVTVYGKENPEDAWEAICQAWIIKDKLELDMVVLPIHIRFIAVNVG